MSNILMLAYMVENQEFLEINGERYELVKERRRGGAVLYRSPDRKKYLRIGDGEAVERELHFHKQLFSKGFPVAEVLSEGELGKKKYWVESSLGEKHFGDIFTIECAAKGFVSDESFAKFLLVVKRFVEAQQKDADKQGLDWDRLAHSLHFDELLLELPDDQESLRAVWEKIKIELDESPICLTHGDFSAHNTLVGGVIDFGDHFTGIFGYDLVTAMTVPFWFPHGEGYEYRQTYHFTEKQIEEFLQLIDIRKDFDALFLLRASWWAMGNGGAPKLQVWRYDQLREIVGRYLRGESLFDFWFQLLP